MWMYYILFIHLSIGGHLGCLNLLAIVNNGAINMHVQVTVGTPIFSYLDYVAGVERARNEPSQEIKGYVGLS